MSYAHTSNSNTSIIIIHVIELKCYIEILGQSVMRWGTYHLNFFVIPKPTLGNLEEMSLCQSLGQEHWSVVVEHGSRTNDCILFVIKISSL